MDLCPSDRNLLPKNNRKPNYKYSLSLLNSDAQYECQTKVQTTNICIETTFMFQNFIFFLQWIERPISPCYTSCISIEHGRATQLQIKSQCIAWLFFTFCFVLFGCCLVVCFFTVTVLLLQRALHSTGGAVVCAHNLAVAPLQCLNYQLVLF